MSVPKVTVSKAGKIELLDDGGANMLGAHAGQYSILRAGSRFLAYGGAFGLALATVLTLVVVPTLYSLIYTSGLVAGKVSKGVRRAYWKPFHLLTGTTPEEEEADQKGNRSCRY